MNDPSLDGALDRALAQGAAVTPVPPTDPRAAELGPLVDAARTLAAWSTPVLSADDRDALWARVNSLAALPEPRDADRPAAAGASWHHPAVLLVGLVWALALGFGIGLATRDGATDGRSGAGDSAPAVGAATAWTDGRVAVEGAAETRDRPPATLVHRRPTEPAGAVAASPGVRTVPTAARRADALAASRRALKSTVVRAARQPSGRPTPSAVSPSASPTGAVATASRRRRPSTAPGEAGRPTVTPGPVLPPAPGGDGARIVLTAVPSPGAVGTGEAPSPSATPPIEPSPEPVMRGIAGRISHADGQPFPGAVVRAQPEGDGAEFVVGLADDAGRYVLVLPAGRWRVQAAAPGHAPRWWPGVADETAAGWVDVVDGRTTEGVDVVLERIE